LQRLITSLRFQVSAAFVLLVALFAAASLATLGAFQRQIDADAVVDIAARLELTANQMHMQAMNYDANAPRDYRTYYRDVELFYRDMMSQMRLFDAVVAGFMSGDFSTVLARPAAWMKPARNPRLAAAVTSLETAWETHRDGLLAALGEDTEEPRLEWAAEYNIEHLGTLEDAAARLATRLREWARDEHARLRLLAASLLGGTLTVAAGLLALLQFYGLRPLKRAQVAVRRATDGDFRQQLPLTGAAEMRDLSAGFNALSARLHLLFQLLERLQRGDDLDDLVGFLSSDFRELLRFDWVGVVLVTPDNATVRLEASALDGAPEAGSKPLFRLPGTLLEQALASGRPMHIRDMTRTAAANPGYEFLRDIADRGLADAIFLPVAAETPAPAVVAFATRSPNRYDATHLRFLNNIAQLISASFGRTVRLAERRRLAAIGEFASGIAHELRTPLSTLTLALEHFSRLPLPDSSHRRLTLASAEAARMNRLLEDMLLYARPLRLASDPVDLVDVTNAAANLVAEQPGCRDRRIEVAADDVAAVVLGDRDRLQQILVNLMLNACQAAGPGAKILVRVSAPGLGRVRVDIDNPGNPIDPDLVERVFEPFFSARAGGTGLGLPIVQRLTALHGGEVTLRPTAHGTTASLTLPTRAMREAGGAHVGPPAAGG
jgi:signal transduction histidine kinase